MSEHPPSRPESREDSHEKRELSPSSIEPVRAPSHTAEEEAKINQARQNLSAHGASEAHGAAEGHDAHASGHHHENKYVKWGVKQPVAIFGYFFSLLWQGLKRWGEMAGKGGGGHAKKAGGDHGGGGHH